MPSILSLLIAVVSFVSYVPVPVPVPVPIIEGME